MSKNELRESDNFGDIRKEKETISVGLFIFKYISLMASFIFLKNFKPIHDLFDIYGNYNETIALLTSKLLGFIDISSTSQGAIIYLPEMALKVGFECSGIEVVLMFSVAVLAYPGKWKVRLIAIFLGFVFLQALNFLRILGLAYSAAHFQSTFETLHIYVAQGVMIATALFTFIAYLNFSSKKNELVS